MKVRLVAPVVTTALFATTVCLAQGPEQSTAVAKDADAYCAYVRGVAHSLSALELLPKAFGTAGVLDGVIVPGGGNAQTTAQQVIVGGTYSLTGIYRGITINQ